MIQLATKIMPRFRAGQSLTAQDLNALLTQSTGQSAPYGEVIKTGVPYASVHFLQGTADFPSSNGTFGVDVFLGESYEFAGYYLTYAGTGTFSVQLRIAGVGVGPVITNANASVITKLDEPRPIYGENKTCSLGVIATSGTITDFCLVFRCWVRA